jgi:hypothetical protein
MQNPRASAAHHAASPSQEQLEFVAKPWVVVVDPGTDDETVWGEFEFRNQAEVALGQLRNSGHHTDLMKRMPDGTLTTEF